MAPTRLSPHGVSVACLGLVSLALALPSSVKSSVKSTRATIPEYTHQSCYVDNVPGRNLNGISQLDDAMDVDKCASFCSSYAFFGLEYGRECYCGNAIRGEIADQTSCSFKCPGNPSQTCGAGNRMDIYAIGSYTAPTPAQILDSPYLGCFVDTGSRLLPKKIIADDAMTAAICRENCAGFNFFGTQYGRECYCGDTEPLQTAAAPESECSFSCAGDDKELCGAGMRLTVYGPVAASTAEPEDPAVIGDFTYQGCFKDNVPQRVISGKVVFDAQMTPAKCAQACSGYAWFGLEYATECYCGASLDAASTAVDNKQCTMKCGGDSGAICGDADRLSVYKIEDSQPVGNADGDVVEGFQYKSCWTDNVAGRALREVFWQEDNMTAEKCAGRCAQYAYFGLEYSRECFCGDELHSGSEAPEAECRDVCVGNMQQLCGSSNRLSLYTKATAGEPENPEQPETPEEPEQPAEPGNYEFCYTADEFLQTRKISSIDLEATKQGQMGLDVTTISTAPAESFPLGLKWTLNEDGQTVWYGPSFRVKRGATYRITIRYLVSSSEVIMLQFAADDNVNGGTSVFLPTTAAQAWVSSTVELTPNTNLMRVSIYAGSSSHGRQVDRSVVWDSIEITRIRESTYTPPPALSPKSNQPGLVTLYDFRSSTVSSFTSAANPAVVTNSWATFYNGIGPGVLFQPSTPGFDSNPSALRIQHNLPQQTSFSYTFTGSLSRSLADGRPRTLHFNFKADANAANCRMQVGFAGAARGAMFLGSAGCEGEWQQFRSDAVVLQSNSAVNVDINCPSSASESSWWIDDIQLSLVEENGQVN